MAACNLIPRPLRGRGSGLGTRLGCMLMYIVICTMAEMAAHPTRLGHNTLYMHEVGSASKNG